MNFEILIVDDDPISILITKKIILSRCNIGDSSQVRIFNLPEQGLNFLQKELESRTDKTYFILLDINMPKIDGFQFLDFCNSNFRDLSLHIIMLTSSISKHHLDLAKSYPLVVSYFTKPFSASHALELSDIIKKCLSQKFH